MVLERDGHEVRERISAVVDGFAAESPGLFLR
jgi:hypothetical protein